VLIPIWTWISPYPNLHIADWIKVSLGVANEFSI